MGLQEERETFRMEVESRSQNEEFARVTVAVFMSRLDPTMEEMDDVKTAGCGNPGRNQGYGAHVHNGHHGGTVRHGFFLHGSVYG